MSNRLVLLANPGDRAALAESGALPHRIWGDLGVTSRSDSEATILCANPSFLTDRKLSDKERREKLGEMLSFSFVHLVVYSNQGKKSDDLTKLEQWYKTFREIAEKDLRHRKHEFKRVLVLVFADHPPAGFLKQLDNIMLTGYEGLEKTGKFSTLLDRCYVMLPELDCGQQNALAAEGLWPYYVGRLLTRLQTGQKLNDGAPLIYAWRGYEIRVPVSNEMLDSAVKRGTELFAEHLNGGIRSETPGEVQFDGARALKKAELVPVPAFKEHGDSWIDVSSREVARTKTDTAAWASAHASAYRACAKSANTLLEQAAPAEAAAQRLWTLIHENPSLLGHFIGKLSLQSSTQADGTAAAERNLSAYLRDWEQWERNCRNLVECAEELRRAQQGYLQKFYRLGLAAAVALAVAFLGEVVLWEVISDSTPAIAVVGGAVLLGAFGGAIVPWMIERRRGEQALELFREQFLKLDRDAATLNETGQDLLVDALNSHDLLAAQAARARARVLLLRARALVDWQSKAGSRTTSTQVFGVGDGTPFVRRQREEFRRETELFLVPATDQQDGVATFAPLNEDIVETVVKKQWDFFLAKWRKYCETDVAEAGHLPAAALALLMKETWLRLSSDLRSESYKGQRDSCRHRDDPLLWAGVLKKLNGQAYNFYLSCMAAGYEVNLADRQTMLFFRKDLERHLSEPLLEAQISTHATSTLVEAACGEALWFQEVPVNLVQNTDGRLTVGRA